MKSFSIVLKLFLIFTIIFSLFISVFLLGQTLFFKKFYIDTKTSNLEKNLKQFSLLYSKDSWNKDDIIRYMNKFADENNTQIAILDNFGAAKYTPDFNITLETSNKDRVKIPLNNIAHLNDFQNLKLAIGSNLEVKGYFSSDLKQIASLESIKNGDNTWENNYVKLLTVPASISVASAGMKDTTAARGTTTMATAEISNTITGITTTTLTPTISAVPLADRTINGNIVDINIPNQIQQVSYYNNDLLWSSIEYWVWSVKTGKFKMPPSMLTKFHYDEGVNNTDNIALVEPVIKGDKVKEYVFAITSLQPVGEAVDMMKVYYWYALFIAIILIAIMSWFFSRIISNPLVKMNRVATKMADFDFSEECTIKSKDEVGNLAKSLNRLSKNLGSSLVELKAANEQLQLDIEKERSLENMRKEFVSSVSHEFKTPLGIIKGFAEGIKDNIAEEKKDYYMEVILDEIDKMDGLVLDLLDLAKLEAKTQKLESEKFSIIELIDEVQSRLFKITDEKKIKLEFKYTERNLQAYGDSRRIEQVITNILNNAIRHTKPGNKIEIGTVIVDDEVLIYIENQGEHIKEEDLSKIWDRFYRAEKSREKKTGGTGLGLSIVKNILELHESRFGAKNTEKGVRFYFTLRIK